MSFLQRYRLALIVSVLMLFGFGLRTYVVYVNTRDIIRNNIIEQGLPLTGDTIYSEINKDILRPVFISSLMAHDTFVKDWLSNGEKDPRQIARYLHEVKSKYHTVSSFLVSDKSHNYYFGEGILKKVSETDKHDVWYFQARQMHADFRIDVDTDQANKGALTVFINHQLKNDKGEFLGITGVGLTLDTIASFIHRYENRFNRTIYFADRHGHIVLRSRNHDQRWTSLTDISGMAPLVPAILSAGHKQPQQFEYQNGKRHLLLNTRYIPDLDWYLLVEQDESEPLAKVTKSLILQSVVYLPILLLVLVAMVVAIQKNQQALKQQAATDPLTGCLNRHAFLEMIPSWIGKLHRKDIHTQVLLLDIDHFKHINDAFGHLAGDELLVNISARLKSAMHQDELLVRWGGEEFLMFLQREESLAQVGERFRTLIADTVFGSGDKAMPISASIGATSWSPAEPADHVIARADQALYTAKNKGRNRVETALPGEVHTPVIHRVQKNLMPLE